METKINTASMDTVANKTKRIKRANKENIECLSESAAPFKKIKAAGAVGAEMKPTAISASLQDQIDKEYKIRDGAGKLLQACKQGKKALEASKSLFVSNAKIIALMKELQKCNSEEIIQPSISEEECAQKPCKAQIAISDVRIPLEWKDFEQQNKKSDSSGCFSVFCLFKMGTQVIDSSVVEVEKSSLDVSFPDKLIFPELVTSEFEVYVELYQSQPVENNAKSPSTPVKVFKKLKKEKPDDSTVSSMTSSPYIPHCPTVVPTHKFTLVGRTTLLLKDVAAHDVCETYSFTKETQPGSSIKSTPATPTLPLWGQFCCRLMAQPECATTIRIQGFINVQQMVNELPAWTRLWCVMRQNTLRCWQYPEDVGRKMPMHTFNFTENTLVENASRLEMRRPNALLVKNKKFAFYIACESKEDREEWSSAIQQAVLDLYHWKHSVKFVIPFTSEKQYSSDTHLVDHQYQPDKTNHSSSKTSLIKVGKRGSKTESHFKSDTYDV